MKAVNALKQDAPQPYPHQASLLDRLAWGLRQSAVQEADVDAVHDRGAKKVAARLRTAMLAMIHMTHLCSEARSQIQHDQAWMWTSSESNRRLDKVLREFSPDLPTHYGMPEDGVRKVLQELKDKVNRLQIQLDAMTTEALRQKNEADKVKSELRDAQRSGSPNIQTIPPLSMQPVNFGAESTAGKEPEKRVHRVEVSIADKRRKARSKATRRQ